jgi:hypothetical protein
MLTTFILAGWLLNQNAFADSPKTIVMDTPFGPQTIAVTDGANYGSFITADLDFHTAVGMIHIPKGTSIVQTQIVYSDHPKFPDDYGYYLHSDESESNPSMSINFTILGQPFRYDIYVLELGFHGTNFDYTFWENNNTPEPKIKMPVNGQTRQATPFGFLADGSVSGADLYCDVGCDKVGYSYVKMQNQQLTTEYVVLYPSGKIRGFELGDQNATLIATDGKSYSYQQYDDLYFNEDGISFPKGYTP